jgi:DnaJ-class molecular chaperone
MMQFETTHAEFLDQLERQAAARFDAARARIQQGAKKCLVCRGTGSRKKYVLPGVSAQAVCITCKGQGTK